MSTAMSTAMTTENAPIDWAAVRAAHEADLLASFNPHVPGMRDEDDEAVIHFDAERNLTYRWFNVSRRVQDFTARERGYLVSRVEVTYTTPDGQIIEVADLNIQHTTKELVAAEFETPFHFADENLGASFNFRYGRSETDQEKWASAYTNLFGEIRPASAADKTCWGAYSASQAPTDPKILKAELKIAERHYAKQMRGFVRWLQIGFVDYSHVYHDVTDENGVHFTHGAGIGKTMYAVAAKHLATYGKILRASGLQSDEAQGLWERIAADPAIPTRRTRSKFYKPTANPNQTYLCIDYTTKTN